jgi:hypothetical protein
MSLSKWQAPQNTDQPPSQINRGHSEKRPLYEAVGRALSEWEYAELSLAWLFSALIESDSAAAARAYGTIGGPTGRRDALTFASEEFFRFRDNSDPQTKIDQDDVAGVIKAYENAIQYRNNIAHGIIMSRIDTTLGSFGWFLQAPEYASKKHDKMTHTSKYYYNSDNISALAKRFSEIQQEAQRLAFHIR